jgi:hypothetical protein
MELEKLVRVSLVNSDIRMEDLLLIRREKNPFKGLLGVAGRKSRKNRL